MKDCFSDLVIVKKDELRNREQRDAAMVTSKSATNLCTLPSVKRTSISVEEK